jgi:hypothetical protein
MKLLRHVALVFAILAASDYAISGGTNSWTLVKEAARPQAVLSKIHLEVHHTSVAMRRQASQLVD